MPISSPFLSFISDQTVGSLGYNAMPIYGFIKSCLEKRALDGQLLRRPIEDTYTRYAAQRPQWIGQFIGKGAGFYLTRLSLRKLLPLP